MRRRSYDGPMRSDESEGSRCRAGGMEWCESSRWPSRNEILLVFVLPLVLLLAATAFFRWSPADVKICSLFYGGAQVGWPLREAEPCLTLYRYGPLPGLVMGVLGVAVAVGSWHWGALRRWREMGLFLALLLALGPGLAVNGILKPRWARPRPQQIKEFGGTHDFIGVWGIGPSEVNKSFPSGHASMGFYLMAPAFLLYRRHPRWASIFVGLGVVGGVALGLARVAQGQHFASDVLWSAGMVYLNGVILVFLFRLASRGSVPETVEEKKPVILSIEERQRGEQYRTERPESAAARGRRAA